MSWLFSRLFGRGKSKPKTTQQISTPVIEQRLDIPPLPHSFGENRLKLKQVISSILRDFTEAQHISDVYSSKLKESYKQDPMLALLNVPRAEIKEVTLDLKFAILKIPCVIVYERFNFQGTSQELSEGNYYDVSSLNIGKNSLNSLKVPNGVTVTLYKQKHLEGDSKEFKQDTPEVEDNFSKAASIKIERNLPINPDDLDIEIITEQLTKNPQSSISSVSLTLHLDNI